MAINKVEFGDQTLIDLTGDTVTEDDVLNGKSFHDKSGALRSGTASYPVTDVQVNNTSVLDGTIAKITQGTAATKDVPTSGNASSSQVVMGNDTRLTDSRNAKDVYAWAKASTKPSYTASEVGLGNVPNVTTDNQTPTVTEASTRANIATGDTLKTIIGKIKKFFTDLKTVAFTGSYNDLTDKPTIPTVNNATLTIQKNGTTVKTFTANASSNVTANITVPTKVSELSNDSGFVTTDTKNTAGSTDTSSKIFLVGATSQAANPQTYSHDTAYVGTDGCLYSSDTKVLTVKTGGGVGSSASTGSGKTWIDVATLTVTSSYANHPILFEISERYGHYTRLEVFFKNVDNKDPGLDTFTSDGNTHFYIKKIDTSTWKIYYSHTHWTTLTIHRITGEGLGYVTVTPNLTVLTEAPTDTIQVTNGWSAAYADDAGTVNGKTVAANVPADAKFTDTTYTAGTGLSLSGTQFNVSTVPIANGGTGATSRLAAAKNLTNENVGTSANYFITFTSSWGKFGYSSVGNVKTILGLGAAAYMGTGTSSDTVAFGNHTHGNITNGGALQTNDITIASGDKLVVTDSSDSAKVARTSISFDGSTATQCLTKKGTWETFGTSNLALGTTSTTALKGDTKYAGASTAGGAATSAEKLGSSTLGGSNQPIYLSSGTATKCNTFVPNTGGTFNAANGTAGGSEAWTALTLGNATGRASDKHSNGRVILYRSSGASATTAYYTEIRPGANTANRTITFPDATGTVALTSNLPFYSGSVNAAVNATTCTINNTNITTSSMIEPFSSNSSGNVITVTKMVVTAGKVVLTFPALTEATSFKVRITNV